MVKEFYPRIKADKTKIAFTADIKCHADPNIANYFARDNFLGSIGQVAAAQSHLKKQGVDVGDLFLFFGWFREIKDGKFIKDIDKYAIFGYLQVGEIICPQKLNATQIAECEAKYPWIKDQPHWDFNKYKSSKNNCIYVAKENCTFDESLKGWGTFAYSQDLSLTKQNANKKSELSIPALKGLLLSKTNGKTFESCGAFALPQTFGQEFVIEKSEQATTWAQNLIKKYAKR